VFSFSCFHARRATSAAAALGTAAAPPAKLVAQAFLRLGRWRWALAEGQLDDATLTDVLTAFRFATDACARWAKAWHHWALFNAAAMEQYARDPKTAAAARRHVAPAISGFFRSVALGGADRKKQRPSRFVAGHSASVDAVVQPRRGA
jgi:FKBP12-rapamycin complex-associated protein